jgi:hypothetical protein
MKRGKKGQLKLSFGMIFSIILIIIFLAFAFYAIKTFLGVSGSASMGKFVNDLQSDVDTAWKSTQSSKVAEYSLPSSVGYVCFVDFDSEKKGSKESLYNELKFVYYGSENLIFYPVGASSLDSVEINHLDLSRITQNDNPFCLENSDGKTQLTLQKNYGDSLVTITE